ncbi:MAG TPA: PQQ-binding-like beta-propeller repeat protein [Polyangiaceae bacterium]
MRHMHRSSIILGALFAVACGSRGDPGSTTTSTTAAALGDDGADWPMYGHDSLRSFANTSSAITPENAGSLAARWTFPTGDAVTAQVVVSGGVAYFGSWDGSFYAVDVETGALRWSFEVDCQNAIVPSPARCLTPAELAAQAQERAGSDGGILTSSALVTGGVVYFGGGRTLYALDERTGALRWKHVICGNPDDPSCLTDANDGNRIFSSPALHGGLLYVGTSVDGQDGYRGGIYAFDAHDGRQAWHFEVDPVLDAKGNPVLGRNGLPAAGYNRGCGNVWTSAAVDEADGTVIFGTSDCNNLPTLPYHDAVLSLDAETGRLRWAFTPDASTTLACDFDIGMTANLAEWPYAALGGKDGTFYLLDRRTGAKAAATNVVFGGSAGGFFGGAAYEGGRFFSATGFGDFGACDPSNPADLVVPQESSMHAFDARTGAVAWEMQGAQSVVATVGANGVLFVTHNDILTGESALLGFDATTGAELLDVPLSASDGPPTPVGRMLLEPTGNLQDGTGGGVTAYALPKGR